MSERDAKMTPENLRSMAADVEGGYFRNAIARRLRAWAGEWEGTHPTRAEVFNVVSEFLTTWTPPPRSRPGDVAYALTDVLIAAGWLRVSETETTQ